MTADEKQVMDALRAALLACKPDCDYDSDEELECVTKQRRAALDLYNLKIT